MRFTVGAKRKAISEVRLRADVRYAQDRRVRREQATLLTSARGYFGFRSDVALRDAIAVDVDPCTSSTESVLIAALDREFAGPNQSLQAPAGLFSAWLAQRRSAEVLDPYPFASTAQRAAIDGRAPFTRPSRRDEDHHYGRE
jgi:hypothetical protein